MFGGLFRRRLSEPRAGDTDHGTPEVSVPPAPVPGWTVLPPLEPTLRVAGISVDSVGFVRDLVTRSTVERVLRPPEHIVAREGGGVVEGLTSVVARHTETPATGTPATDGGPLGRTRAAGRPARRGSVADHPPSVPDERHRADHAETTPPRALRATPAPLADAALPAEHAGRAPTSDARPARLEAGQLDAGPRTTVDAAAQPESAARDSHPTSASGPPGDRRDPTPPAAVQRTTAHQNGESVQVRRGPEPKDTVRPAGLGRPLAGPMRVAPRSAADPGYREAVSRSTAPPTVPTGASGALPGAVGIGPGRAVPERRRVTPATTTEASAAGRTGSLTAAPQHEAGSPAGAPRRGTHLPGTGTHLPGTADDGSAADRSGVAQRGGAVDPRSAAEPRVAAEREATPGAVPVAGLHRTDIRPPSPVLAAVPVTGRRPLSMSRHTVQRANRPAPVAPAGFSTTTSRPVGAGQAGAGGQVSAASRQSRPATDDHHFAGENRAGFAARAPGRRLAAETPEPESADPDRAASHPMASWADGSAIQRSAVDTMPSGPASVRWADDPGQAAVDSGLVTRDADGAVVFAPPPAMPGARREARSGAGLNVQRQEAGPAASPPPPASEPRAPSSVAPPVAPPLIAPLPAAPPAAPDLAVLADDLYERIERRLRVDLLLERQRRGTLADE